jgi:hypothetical protein
VTFRKLLRDLFRFSSAILCIAPFVSLPALASDVVYAGGGTLAQIVDGGGTKTTITLINLDSTPADYALYFYDDNGNPLPLVTDANPTAGVAAAVLYGTLAARGSAIIKSAGASASTVEGWALLITDNTVAGSAVFGIPLNGQFAEASCPLDTGADTEFGLPFDSTTAVTGVALANSWLSTPLTVGVSVYDMNGTLILTDNITLPGNGHTAFLLSSRYPQLANQQGFAVFTGSYYMNVLGLRATANTYTSVTPIVADGW